MSRGCRASTKLASGDDKLLLDTEFAVNGLDCDLFVISELRPRHFPNDRRLEIVDDKVYLFK